MAPAAATPESDAAIQDGDMLRAIVKGCAVGIPLVFVILFVIDLAAGLSVPLAALGASIPGVIFGAFIGSAIFIGRASDEAQRRASH